MAALIRFQSVVIAACFDAGSTTALPGDSGSYVTYETNNTLLISAGGHNETLSISEGAKVQLSASVDHHMCWFCFTCCACCRGGLSSDLSV